jgi:hypothetical protein
MALDETTLLASFQMNHPKDNVFLDVDYIDTTIEGHGVKFIHYRAIPCPVGLGDRYDIRKTHSDHAGCSNGFLYEKAGEVLCAFTGNGKNQQFTDVGMLGEASAQVTVPRYYANTDKEEVLLSPMDRLYLAENSARVVHFQKFEHNQTGMDRTSYPILEVETLIDSDGRRYNSSQFTIIDGQINWTSNVRPGMDPATNKGQVCSIRYRYVPYWYVSRILHEIRLVRASDPTYEANTVQRAPYQVVLEREYMFENEQNDVRAPKPDSPRQAVAPRSGTFGPR